jgi:hypothetical protein
MIISNCLASDGWSESLNWSWGLSISLSSSGDDSSVFSLGLIEPYSNVSLPMFSEVIVWDDVIMFNH